MGSRAVVAVVEAVGDAQRIVVHQVDAGGAELGAGVISMVGTVSGTLTVTADPSGGARRRVVGARTPGAPNEVLRVAKLTCSGGV